MGIGIGSLLLLAFSVVIVFILVVKLRRKEVQSQHKTLEDNHQCKNDMELSAPKSSAYTAPSANPAAKQGKRNFYEHDEVVSPNSNAGQYETMSEHQTVDQNHIYSEI